MCYHRPIDLSNLLAPIPTALPPGEWDCETQRRGDAENAETPAPEDLNTEDKEDTETPELPAAEATGGPPMNGYDVLGNVMSAALLPSLPREWRTSILLAARAFARKKASRQRNLVRRAHRKAPSAPLRLCVEDNPAPEEPPHA